MAKKNDNLKLKLFKKIYFPIRLISGHNGEIKKIVSNNKKKILISGSNDSRIKIWNLKNYSHLSNLIGHLGCVNDILLCDKYNFCFSGGDDMIIKCWDLEYNKNIANFYGHHSAITSLSLHPVLNIIVSSSRDCSIRIWDMRMRKEISTLLNHSDTVTSVITNTESPHIISSSIDKKICLWDIVINKPVFTTKKNDSPVLKLIKGFSENYFFSLSKKEIKIFRKDGMLLKSFVDYNSINKDFCLSKNEIIISKYAGFLNFKKVIWKEKKAVSLYTENLFYKELLKNEMSSLHIENSTGDFFCGVGNRICIFKKKWKQFDFN